ncbi:MAG TPA: sigma-54-dependent Fis family transcriptional regulator [Noviherbaspirillum sp.]
MNSITDGNLPDLDNRFSSGIAPCHSGEHALAIRQSHARSLAYGVCEASALHAQAPNALPLDQDGLQTCAGPVMESLAMYIDGTHSAVVLADAKGIILHMLGDADFLEKAGRIGLSPGNSWSEQSKGTNAIGIVLASGEPGLVHVGEQYLPSLYFLTSAAAPIFDGRGEIAGVLSVSGDRTDFQNYTLPLVRMSARMIENQLLRMHSSDCIMLHFGMRPEYIGTLEEGIACFTPGGRFTTANRAGLAQLRLPLAALQAHTFGSLFGLGLPALFEHYSAARPELLELRLPGGGRIWARTQLRLVHGMPLSTPAPSAPSAPPAAPVHRSMPHQPWHMPTLRCLDTGDPAVACVIAKVRKVCGSGIPVLINGETGTGKELLAQAIHNDSPRAKGPFVAVNCASIPETLIESELFGYEDGAFTGARKKGSIGKIPQADGGTLFLDEIGDMPLNLQARLLRVLQMREVVPLGSTKSIPVDVEVVCATHRNLRELIAEGRFREDLYYRLNGLVVKLPPMRERSDIDEVIARVLKAETGGSGLRVAPEVMQLFRRHRWPGNFRQMHNLLRIAAVMAAGDREIRLEHLPDDFIDEQAAQVPASPVASSASSASTAPMAGAGLIDVELQAIRQALDAHSGNVSAAARALGISRNTIYRKMSLLKQEAGSPGSPAVYFE